MKNHFELTEEFKINAFGVKVFRIKATKSFKSIKKGDLGGFIEKEINLIGNAWVYGNAQVSGNADYCVFQNFGSRNRSTTFFKTKRKNTIKVKCGCFEGTLNQFENQVKETHKGTKYEKEYLAIIEVVKIKFEL